MVVFANRQVGGRWTAAAAGSLFAVFTVAVAMRLRTAEPAPCGCFGETSPEPVGSDTLVRNIVLTAMAALGVVRGAQVGRVEVIAGVVVGLLIVAQSRSRIGVRR